MGSSDGRGYRRTLQLHDGYRRRNDVFLIALLVSLALHAATILLAPGFRRPAFKMAQTMNVLLMPPAPAPRPPATPAPPEAAPPPPSPPKARPEKPVPPQPQPDVTPQNAPEAQSPQLALKPAPVPKSAPIPKPNPEPKAKPAPKPKAEPKPEPKPAPGHTHPEAAKQAPRRHRAAKPPEHHHAAPVTPAPPSSTAVSPQPSTPPVTATPSPAPSPRVDDLLDRYGKRLAQIVAGGQHYPRIAQMRGWQGTVEIEITVTPPGTADGITIQRSSGHQVLDDEALDMVKRALPLPEPPAPLRDHRFTVVVPIVFRLR